LDISGYHTDLHERQGTVGEWQGRGMTCELTQHGTEGEQHGCSMTRVNKPLLSKTESMSRNCSQTEHYNMRL
jgi:hypothetical protein